jgi:NTE family protein
MGRLALVLSGGGARGAYEAGVIHYIRTGLPKETALRPFEIQCGSSAGAINTAAMVSMANDPVSQGNHLRDLWLKIRQEDVYRRDIGAAAQFLASSFVGILRNLATFDIFKIGKRKGPHLTSFLDTAPLSEYLRKKIPWSQLHKNVKEGPVAAVSVTVTNTRSGRSELFICKKPEVTYTGDYRHHFVNLETEHIMASAAIPIIFPTVKVERIYYTDGGLRLFTPMSPAIQLGADRIVIVGLRHRATPKEIQTYDGQEMKSPPSLAEMMGRLMNGLFLDRVQFDLEQSDRINKIIEWSERVYGKDYLDRINDMLKHRGETGDVANRGLQNIRVVEILPSQFISEIFGRWFHKQKKNGNFRFSTLEKLLTRLLDIDTPGAIELLSYLTFADEYIKDLIDLGYEDAKRNRDRLMDLMSP